MSKFCENCGTELKDTDKVCPNCGAQVENVKKEDVKVETSTNTNVKAEKQESAEKTESNVNTNTNNSTNAAKKSNNTKLFAIIGGVAVALIVFIAILIGTLSGSYTKPLDYMCKGLQKASSKTYVKAFPSFMKSDIEKYYSDDTLEKQLDDFEDEYGKNIKISYKVLDKEKIDKDDLEKVEDKLKDRYDGKKIKVTAGYKLTVKMTIKGKTDKDSDTTKFYVYKINGKWSFSSSTSL